MNLFCKLHAQGNTIIVVTHDKDIAGQTQRIIFLRDGKIEWDKAKGETT
ncbi:MAG: macrolide ABC transporter ATP-binding protein, partial [Acidobacteriota bacterium]